jgi:hypothetical protein
METCEVTFDETQPRNQLVFECAGDDEHGEEIFQEQHEHGDDELKDRYGEPERGGVNGSR